MEWTKEGENEKGLKRRRTGMDEIGGEWKRTKEEENCDRRKRRRMEKDERGEELGWTKVEGSGKGLNKLKGK